MKKRALGLVIVAAAVIAAALVFPQTRKSNNASLERPAPVSRRPPSQTIARVPAHYEIAPSPDSLGATLSPTKFFGKTKEAYEAARKIPVTLAQLPCYCHCDQSFGHQSLHSCFEDEHAASCAVCVDEALLAYKLEKSGQNAAQIRAQIVAKYETH